MKLCVSRGRSSTIYYLGESFRDKSGKSTTRIVGRLGSEAQLREKLGPDADIEQWAKDQVKALNAKKKAGQPVKLQLVLEADVSYKKGEERLLNVGYMFLRKILYTLGFDKISDEISKRHSFYYDYGSILTDLICARILLPKESRANYDSGNTGRYEAPSHRLHAVYRALEVTIRENEFIQSCLYNAVTSMLGRSPQNLFYHCLNCYFEIPEADEVRQYGEYLINRPSPVVQAGMFLDDSGIPLSFSLFSRRRSSRQKPSFIAPIEEQILRDCGDQEAELTLCADENLIEEASARIEGMMQRDFIVLRPIKNLPPKLRRWVLNPGRSLAIQPIRRGEQPDVSYQDLALNGWRCDAVDGLCSLDDIDEDDPESRSRLYYKERYVTLEQGSRPVRLIVTYSPSYKSFMQKKRTRDLEMANKLIKQCAVKKADLLRPNDITRYIKVSPFKDEWGETRFELDREEILLQSSFDGFRAVSTSFNKYQKSASEIAGISRDLGEMEEAFRFVKSEFKARPIFLKTEDQIRAQVIVSFISIVVIRTLQLQLNAKRRNPFSIRQIVSGLRRMQVTKIGRHFTGSFTRTEFTDALQKLMDMKFDCELITEGTMEKNAAQSRRRMAGRKSAY